MSLFGSEEAMRRYVEENPQWKGYPITLEQAFAVMQVIAGDRLSYDYVTPFTRMYLTMRKLGIKGPFWWPGPISGLKFMLEKGIYWK